MPDRATPAPVRPSRLPSFAPALRHRNYRLFLVGQAVSLSGTWMQIVALGWLVLELTDSAFAVGLVGAMGSLPVLLFTLQAGAVATRVNRLRLVTLLQALMLVQAAVLAVITWTGHATLGWLVVLALAFGTLSAFEIPTRQTLLMDLVGRDDLMNAIALHSTTFNTARVLGPAIGGVVTAAFGPAVAFGLNALSYLAVLASLFAVRLDPALVQPREEAPPLKAALAYIFAPGWPRALVTLTAVYTIFGVSFLTVLPVYARDVLGTGAGGYGALTSAFGIGAACGALLLAAFGSRFRRGELALRTGLLVGTGLTMLGLFPLRWLATVMIFGGGLAVAGNAITTNTMLQTEAPANLRGRVIGVYAFIVVGLSPFGSLRSGWVSQLVGVRLEAVLAGLVCATATLWTIHRMRGQVPAGPNGPPGGVDRRAAGRRWRGLPYRWQERRRG